MLLWRWHVRQTAPSKCPQLRQPPAPKWETHAQRMRHPCLLPLLTIAAHVARLEEDQHCIAENAEKLHGDRARELDDQQSRHLRPAAMLIAGHHHGIAIDAIGHTLGVLASMASAVAYSIRLSCTCVHARNGTTPRIPMLHSSRIEQSIRTCCSHASVWCIGWEM